MNGGRNGKDPFLVLPPKSQAIIIGGKPVHDQIIGSYPMTDQHHRLHQRASSESVLIDEQPFWLDDLLNDPDTPPVRKGAPYHCRSSSESFTYVSDDSRRNNINRNNNFSQLRNVIPRPHPSAGSSGTSHNHQTSGGGRPVALNMVRHGSSSSGGINKTQNHELRDDHWIEDSIKNHSPQFDTDPKRAKQQFAQRSRVRKMQYIAELERHIQALQSQGCEVSAEIQFSDQQNFILNLENDSLRQRLDSLVQEHIIKQYHQEMLEREIDRIRSYIMQQQQHQIQQGFMHGRSSMGSEVDNKFANLSLKHKDSNQSPLRM